MNHNHNRIDYLEFAKQLANDARKIALEYYRLKKQSLNNSDKSLVSIADKEINDLVIKKIKSKYPDHGVLGEEQSWQLDKDYLWVCDPIDGTKDYLMGIPNFMFSIALVVRGVPLIGVICDLANGELYYASKGGGSYIDSKTIKVSERNLKESWLVIPASLRRLSVDNRVYSKMIDNSYQNNFVYGYVKTGTIIAQGLADGLVLLGSVKPWDFAAVSLLVKEAGGKLTDIYNKSPCFDKRLNDGIIISNNIIHKDLVNIVNDIN